MLQVNNMSAPASADELAASEARYRSLVQASSAIVWGTTPRGLFETEQPGWAAYTGQSFEQFRAWGWLDAIHPDDRAATTEAWNQALSSGTMYLTEHRLRAADGVFRFMNARAVPVRGADGQVLEWIGVHIDIDERKRVEERLMLLDAMSQATRNASDPTEIMEATTRLLGQHLGVTRCPYATVETDNNEFNIRHDWVAPGAISTVGVYSLDLFGERAATSMRAGHTLCIRDVDRELAAADGAAMFNAIACRAIICCPLVKGGRLLAMMAVHQDRPRDWTAHEVALVEESVERSWAHIERVRATEALRDADRRKSEFLAILAHELRNPLAPIRNGLQVMRLAENDRATVARVRDMMERQVTQMVDLVNDLLDVARITRGDFELKRSRIALETVLAQAVETSMPLIESNQHMLRIDVAAGQFEIDADPTRIAQVIGNVLHNAAKFTPPGGSIDILARREGGAVLLTVSDSGIGIPPSAASSIFEMFSQVGESVDRAHGGLGIGLSLARRLLELHGGSIRLATTAGPGSTFEIRLPLVAANDDEAVADNNTVFGEGPSAPRALRVLVVDDNGDAAEMLSALLSIIGHQTQVANNGIDALALAAQFRPEVVFLDIGMPGMNGYELAERLGCMPELDGMVRIALTGWGEQEDRARSKAAGFDHHLLKPCNLGVVQSLLADLAARPRLLRD
ncbi:MAG: ATP-binding protein [Pseudomonadota bacterium]